VIVPATFCEHCIDLMSWTQVIKSMAIPVELTDQDQLIKIASTSLNSKVQVLNDNFELNFFQYVWYLCRVAAFLPIGVRNESFMKLQGR